MAVTITISDVRTNPIAASTPDDIITGFIAVVDQADTCLDANSVPDAIQRTLKLNGVWHLIETTSRGNVSSERDGNGASVSYGEQTGLQSTGYGQTVSAIDQHGCLKVVIGASGQTVFVEVLG